LQRTGGEAGIPRALAALFKRGVTAILVPGERWGITAMHYLNLIGKRVPGDVSLIGGEFAHHSEFLDPPQTCLRQDLDAIIGLGIGKLLDGGARDSGHSFVDVALIERESVADLAGGEAVA
jgi:DNA-binding LacI/PurR family transcriptional regulator